MIEGVNMGIYEDYLSKRQACEGQAGELLLNLQMLAQNHVNTLFFGEKISLSVNALIAQHDKHHLDIADAVKLTKDLYQQSISHATIDIGQALKQHKNASDFVSGKPLAVTDVVLYGFGRIGRILARLMTTDSVCQHGLQLRAIVVRPAGNDDLAKRASLLQRDSVHGWFDGHVAVDEENNGILVNGRFIQVIYASEPSDIDYTQYGIDHALIIDNTGKWKDEAGLAKHLSAKGAQKVLLTAPAKGEIKNIVYGVNHNTIGDDTIVSAASCTTNAITPILKVLHDEYTIDHGHMETIHAFTNDQNLVDNYHKADRRGRSAPLNMVMTSTGAASAVAKAIPELKGKLSGSSIRVPTPNVSLAILNLNFEKAIESADAINDFIKAKSQSKQWQAQIDYSDSTEAVSTDFVGCKKVAIFDAKATIATDKRATLYVWYDNEMGYSTQVIRVAQMMMNAEHSNTCQ